MILWQLSYFFVIWSALFTFDTTAYKKLPEDWIKYEKIMDDFWLWRLQQVPEFATSLGIHDYDDKLEKFTFEAFDHRKNTCDEFLFRIDNVNASFLTSKQIENLLLLREEIETYIKGYRWSRLSTLNPINFLEGIHKDFTFWLDSMILDKEADFSKYIQRLRALATQIYEQMNLMQEAIKSGWINHKISLDGVLPFLDGLVSVATETPFFNQFNDYLENSDFTLNKIDMLREEIIDVISDQVLPAYRKLRSFLENEYIPSTRPHISISSLSGGTEFYRDCIRWYTGEVDVLPIDMHINILKEIERLRQSIDEIREIISFRGTVASFMRYMETASQFFYISGDDIIKHYKQLLNSEIMPYLQKISYNITMPPLKILSMPFDGPNGVVVPSSDDGSMPAVFFANTQNLHKRPKWLMVQTVLQEAVPGHYFQINYALNQTVPFLRRKRELRKMHSVPFQFPFYSAYTKGWALYASTLGEELGLLNDVHKRYGHFYEELLNAARVAVDTGIHTAGWTKEKAIVYLMTVTAMSREIAEKEVKTCITLPGHTVTGTFGLTKIRRLRLRAQQLLGGFFNLKEFHHQILRNGPMSLKSLSKSFEIWLSYSTTSSFFMSSSHIINAQIFTCIISLTINLLTKSLC